MRIQEVKPANTAQIQQPEDKKRKQQATRQKTPDLADYEVARPVRGSVKSAKPFNPDDVPLKKPNEKRIFSYPDSGPGTRGERYAGGPDKENDCATQ